MPIISDHTNTIDSTSVTGMSKPVTLADASLTLYGLALANGVPIQFVFPTTDARDKFYKKVVEALGP